MKALPNTVAALVAIAALVGCGSKSETQSSASAHPDEKSAPAKAPSASAAASAAKPPAPEDPYLAAIAAGEWKDPTGGPNLKLVDVNLKDCFFDGYRMRLPEGGKVKTLIGARACHLIFPGKDPKQAIEAVIISDEIPFPVATRESVASVKDKPYDVPDAFVYAYDTGKEKGLEGGWTGKFGERTFTCKPFNREFDYVAWRSTIELCRTITAVKKP